MGRRRSCYSSEGYRGWAGEAGRPPRCVEEPETVSDGKGPQHLALTDTSHWFMLVAVHLTFSSVELGLVVRGKKE